ncbi:MAG: class I SAM-dependent methyltransferase [Planctomycetota bacterium]
MRNKNFATGDMRGDWNQRARQDFRHAVYSPTSGEQDDESFWASGVREARFLAALLDLDISIPLRIAELGCGAGRLLLPLSKQYPQHRFIGLDISDEMVRLGREHGSDQRNLTYEMSGAEHLPLQDESIDALFSAHVLMHVPKRFVPIMIREFRRTLRPGGQIILQLPSAKGGKRLLQALLGRDRDPKDTYHRRYYTNGQVFRLLSSQEFSGICVTQGFPTTRDRWFSARRNNA